MKEAILYQRLSENRVECRVCPRRCLIPDGSKGYCRTRLNHAGKLFSLIFGRIGSLAISPIEKKPLYHYYPGSLWLSLGTRGCNFRCPGCQNWELAHRDPEMEDEGLWFLSPEELVNWALRGKCLGISFTYNEPTVWLEYALEGARLARARGLLTNFVTNGFITLESFDQIGPYLDSFRMDLKGMTKETYQRMAHLDDFAPLLQSAQRAKKKWGMHVEIVTNVIPGFNDSPEELQAIARWIKDHLGPETPWHVTRFYPHYRLSHLSPTAIATLEMARDIGRRSGLTFVYLGNVPGHPGENTYCPRCQRILIHRRGFVVLGNFLRSGCCPDCGTPIPGRF